MRLYTYAHTFSYIPIYIHRFAYIPIYMHTYTFESVSRILFHNLLLEKYPIT